MKFVGEVGFWIADVETKSGIYTDKMIERHYTGDITRAYDKWSERNNSTTDDLRLNNQISIVGDIFALENHGSIKYVLWNGIYWKVNTIGINPPRLVMEIGGVWNGEKYTKDQASGDP